MRITLRLLIVAACASGIAAAWAADITGTVTLKGTPPPERDITDMAKDPHCGKLHTSPVKTRFYVVGANGGLADVVVHLKGLSGKSAGPSAPPVVIDQKGCEYLPYVQAAQTSQKIVVKNSDPLLHNVHPTPNARGNDEKNVAQMAGGPDLTFTFPTPEMFLRFKCDVHPWMFAYVSVFDHPYFAVTDDNGKFKITDVPPGKYTIEAVHRKAHGPDYKGVTKEIEVTADGVKVDFEIAVK